MRHPRQRGDERARVVQQRHDDPGHGGGDVGQAPPPFGHGLRHDCVAPPRRLGGGDARREHEVAPGQRRQADVVAPSPEGGMERGHVLDEAGVLLRREGRARGEQGRADVAQQDPPDGAVEVRGHDGVVDDGWEAVEEPALPQQDIGATGVAGRPEKPVVPRVLVLEDEGLAVDDDPFEAGPRLGVVGHPRRAALGPAQELVEAGGPLSHGRPRPSRPGARPASGRRTRPGPARSCLR